MTELHDVCYSLVPLCIKHKAIEQQYQKKISQILDAARRGGLNSFVVLLLRLHFYFNDFVFLLHTFTPSPLGG